MSRFYRGPTAAIACLTALAFAARTPAADREAGTADDEGPRPRLRVSETSFDWGELLEGEEAVHTFRVHNDGDAPLALEKIKPG